MGFNLDIPQRCIISGGGRSQLPIEAARLGWKRPLIVTDPFHADSGKVDELVGLLRENQIVSCIYKGVTGEPTTDMVESALRQHQTDGCDGVIGFGGGSPLDTAKTVAVLLRQPGPVQRLMGLHKVDGVAAPCIAIPTTAGTGAEATKVVVITDSATDDKMMRSEERRVGQEG